MRKYSFHTVFCLFLFLPSSGILNAQTENGSGARAASLSGSDLTLTDVWSCFNNQACLALLQYPSTGIHYENRFFVNELSLQSLAIAFPAGDNTIGINYLHFGYSLFQENKFGLAIGKMIFKNFSLGIQLDFFLIHIGEGAGSTGALAVETGMIYQPTEKLHIASHIYNPTCSRYHKFSKERIPVIIQFGSSFHAVDELAFYIEIEKEIHQIPVLKCGCEYNIVNKIKLRAGISSSRNARYSFGTGVLIKNITCDIAFSYHPSLNYSPYLSIQYVFK